LLRYRQRIASAGAEDAIPQRNCNYAHGLDGERLILLCGAAGDSDTDQTS